MKSVLKVVAIFALGLVVGCGVTGFVLNRFHKGQMAFIRASDVGLDAMLAQFLREGNAQLILESADKRLVEGVIELSRNDEFKDMLTAETALSAAKRYYVCTKTEYPAEIAQIMNDLPPGLESQCHGPE